jgi:outer membrane protein assembly factor BamB
LICLSFKDGSVKWISPINNKKGELYGPLIINGDIVVFSENGNMMKFNAQDGKIKESVDLKTSISSTPIIVDGSMYLISGSSNVVCLR